MSDMGKDTLLDDDDAVEALLGKAAPRPVPPDVETEAVREAVRAEWQTVTGQRRNHARITQWAIAASMLLALFVTLNLLRTSGIEPHQVATIDKQFGTISVLGEDSQFLQHNSLDRVVAGQTIRTSADSGLGLAWSGGGSLRIDANSRIEFLSADAVYLHDGRIYFDSAPALAAGSISGSDVRFTVRSRFGQVAHVGTQYMAQTDGVGLTISVRDGEVEVQPERGDAARAGRNQQMAISGSGVRSIVNIQPHGGAWQWVEQTSPAADLDGRSVSDFLGWVSHETGLAVSYEDDAARTNAEKLLIGKLETGPREALNVWMLGTDLDWRIENGVIYVSQAR